MQTTKITLDTKLKKGDIIISRAGYHYKALGTLEDLVFFSEAWGTWTRKGEFENKSGSTLTIQQLVANKYSLVAPLWSPDELKEGDEYWSIDSQGRRTVASIWHKDSTDILRKKMNIIFQTEELAKASLQEMLNEQCEKD